jgi:tyrosine-specific transport protein
MGVVPRTGDNGLVAMLHSGRSNSEFVTALSVLLQRETITVFARIFTSICLATSFLGVALSLSDFLADGLHLAKKGTGNLFIYTLTFLPPLIIVLFYPGAFIGALSYAGIYCVILLVLLPALMAWSGRYRKQLASPQHYRAWGGKPLLVILIVCAVLIIGNSFIS